MELIVTADAAMVLEASDSPAAKDTDKAFLKSVFAINVAEVALSSNFIPGNDHKPFVQTQSSSHEDRAHDT